MNLSDNLKYYLLQLLSNQTFVPAQSELAGEVNDFITYLKQEQEEQAAEAQASLATEKTADINGSGENQTNSIG